MYSHKPNPGSLNILPGTRPSGTFEWTRNGSSFQADHTLLGWGRTGWNLEASTGDRNSASFQAFFLLIPADSESTIIKGKISTPDFSFQYFWNVSDQYGDVWPRSTYLEGHLDVDINVKEHTFEGKFVFQTPNPEQTGIDFRGDGTFNLKP